MHADRPPLVLAHRGASGCHPEHSRAAYEAAFAQGADGVELDVVASRDGVLVVRHENEISGTTDVAEHPEFASRRTVKEIDGREVAGWFTEDFTWAELTTLRCRERMPRLRPDNTADDGRFPLLRLEDVFALADRAAESAGRELGVVVEIKHQTHFAGLGLPLDELLAPVLADSGWSDRPDALGLTSFEHGVLASPHLASVPAARIAIVQEKGAPADEVARLGSAAAPYTDLVSEAGLAALAAESGPTRTTMVSIQLALVLGEGADGAPASSGLVERVRAAGLATGCWTLRPENRFLPAPFRRRRRPGAWGDWRGLYGLVVATGVDALFADHPDLAVSVRDTR